MSIRFLHLYVHDLLHWPMGQFARADLPPPLCIYLPHGSIGSGRRDRCGPLCSPEQGPKRRLNAIEPRSNWGQSNWGQSPFFQLRENSTLTPISPSSRCRPREGGDPYTAAQRCGTADENNIVWWLWVPASAGTTA